MPHSLRDNVRLNLAKEEYCELALSPRTRASYATGVNTFATFCTMHNINFLSGDWIGLEDIMVYFVCFCANIRHLAYATIKSYLAGVRNYCIAHNFEYPYIKTNGQPMLQLQLVLKGIKKARLPKSILRLPVTAMIMEKLFLVLDGRAFGTYNDKLMRAAITMAYFGFLRCGEFTTLTNDFDAETNLCLGDVSISSTDLNEAFIILKASKTDPFRCGHTIPYFKVECIFCPVKALSEFVTERSKFARDLTAPLLLFHDYSHLTRTKFLHMLHETCAQGGINGAGFLGHSFRIGAATTCAKRGVADHLIQSLGRWKSDCYKTYVHVAKSSIREAHIRMAVTD